MVRSEGNSHATDDDGDDDVIAVVVVVVDPEIGDLGEVDDKLVLDDTGNDKPAALIATLSGIVMNGC